ncbi:hypothetical protein KDL01_19240 [Actinospica durhamensis]|uniref:Uncharacterized protein n=1 Tax=Actinospica durhamensis TaxID=1508375 RepID=A0A941EQR0_9ACTN|nr:hypothetical protein [Actinospica durhamensis]MBR7835418.1 hypothetical protein [Actinospica durhamensis]
MDEWWSIEIFGNGLEISTWVRTRGRDVIRTALEYGASDWQWHAGSWGVVVEFCFGESTRVGGGWTAFMDSPLVKAALDAVPDPINGLIYYPGRGGTALASVPRRPRPAPAAAAAALPVPEPEQPRRPQRAGGPVLAPARVGSLR